MEMPWRPRGKQEVREAPFRRSHCRSMPLCEETALIGSECAVLRWDEQKSEERGALTHMGSEKLITVAAHCLTSTLPRRGTLNQGRYSIMHRSYSRYSAGVLRPFPVLICWQSTFLTLWVGIEGLHFPSGSVTGGTPCEGKGLPGPQ